MGESGWVVPGHVFNVTFRITCAKLNTSQMAPSKTLRVSNEIDGSVSSTALEIRLVP